VNSGVSGQNLASSIARLQEIEDSIRPVLGQKRFWITPEEFLANIEAHRRKHDRERRNAKSLKREPATVREYFIKPRAPFVPKSKPEREEAA
jgi:hypothetical protein